MKGVRLAPSPQSVALEGSADARARIQRELSDRLWQFQPVRGWRVRLEALVNPKRTAFRTAPGAFAVAASSVVTTGQNALLFTLNDGDALVLEDVELALQSAQANPAAGTAPGLTLLAYALALFATSSFVQPLALLPVVGPVVASATVGSPIFAGTAQVGSSVVRLDSAAGGGHGFAISGEELASMAAAAGVAFAFPQNFALQWILTIANSTAGGINATPTTFGSFRKFEGIETA